ncbi:hypothetical protein SRB17_48740 [Streptomyces sp. RB17]|uniref:organomercurial lyase n=1 Tax=Streptomyces sp. RB17 TaxID=2585197 RepID=UPI001308CD7F|nr:organomercurial lyase [Streptomyces sp. RB17]MQY36872.1 hypothetical protein [Streptomyces sp. RB17]
MADRAADDSLAPDDHGRIRAAYTFSALPTAHQTRLADGIEVSAMCAIDALAAPDTLGTDAAIASADPWARRHPDYTGKSVARNRA